MNNNLKVSAFSAPLLYDGFGIVITQVMTCGPPVLATEVTKVRGLITNGEGGIAASAPAEAQVLAEAIDALLPDSADAQAADAAARWTIKSLQGGDGSGRHVVEACHDAGLGLT